MWTANCHRTCWAKTLRTPHKGQGLCKRGGLESKPPVLYHEGSKQHRKGWLATKSGVWTMQTKGLAYNLQGSVPGAGLAWNLVFWRQTLSIVGGWSEIWELTLTMWTRNVNDPVRHGPGTNPTGYMCIIYSNASDFWYAFGSFLSHTGESWVRDDCPVRPNVGARAVFHQVTQETLPH